jgi:hypothetical protein
LTAHCECQNPVLLATLETVFKLTFQQFANSRIVPTSSSFMVEQVDSAVALHALTASR